MAKKHPGKPTGPRTKRGKRRTGQNLARYNRVHGKATRRKREKRCSAYVEARFLEWFCRLDALIAYVQATADFDDGHQDTPPMKPWGTWPKHHPGDPDDRYALALRRCRFWGGR